MRSLGMICTVLLMLASCAKQTRRNEVLVLGTIHGEHLSSTLYSVERLQEIIRKIDPDFILAEIPPRSLRTAQEQFQKNGIVLESRVRHFPEYVDAVFPLQASMKFKVVGCAAWTSQMAHARQALLKEWKTSRAEETMRIDTAMVAAEKEIARGFHADDPRRIHSPQYDQLVREGMTPYSEIFGEDLGAGGWQAINRAHYALIEEAIAEHGTKGSVRFLVIFGAWHKYWFLEKLGQHSDLQIIPVSDFL